MTHIDQEKSRAQDKSRGELESCPHCGQELSPWQQILLKVDRGLVCSKCWYRIILDPPEPPGMEEKRDSVPARKDEQ